MVSKAISSEKWNSDNKQAIIAQWWGLREVASAVYSGITLKENQTVPLRSSDHFPEEGISNQEQKLHTHMKELARQS